MIMPTSHLSDGDLFRFMDGEGKPDELDTWSKHLEGCPGCREELATLRSLTSRLGSTLAAVPEGFLERTRPDYGSKIPLRASAGFRLRPPGWLQAAAVVLLLVTSLVVVEPLRAWVVNWLSGGLRGEAPAVVRELSTPRPGAQQTVIRFSTAHDSLTLEVGSRQSAGALRLHRGLGTAGVVQIEAGTARTLVSERVVRIENSPHSTADIDFWTPVSARHLSLRVAGDRLADIPVDTFMTPVVIPLGAGGAAGAAR